MLNEYELLKGHTSFHEMVCCSRYHMMLRGDAWKIKTVIQIRCMRSYQMDGMKKGWCGELMEQQSSTYSIEDVLLNKAHIV